MGGYNSGRYRTRNRGAVDAAIRLDIRVLRRLGFLVPGAVTSGVVSWSQRGEETGSVSVNVNLRNPDAGFMLINFALNGDPRSQRIALLSQAMRYGGRRYYFTCPKHGRRCEVLPIAGGVFASRQAHRLTYHSQSESEMDRMRSRARKLEKRLWPDKGKPVPRGRNRERLLEAWKDAEAAFEGMFAETVLRRWGDLLP